MQLEEYLRGDDRIVLPLGSVEQHAYLSLAVDQILAERVSVEAAEPLGVPVLPALPYGIAPYFAAYPGSPTLSAETYGLVLRELIDALYAQGFRRFLVVNGHGGNEAGRPGLDRLGGRASRGRDPLAQLVERAGDMGRGAGDRPAGQPRVLAREFPLDAADRCRATARAQADGGRVAGARDCSGRKYASCSGTAPSAGCTSGRTRTS